MKFYTNNILFEIVPFSETVIAEDHKQVLGYVSVEQIFEYYELVRSNKVRGTASFVFKVVDYQAACESFKKHFFFIEAAGGIVQKDNQLLFMRRMGKWDLPKGKIEAGEDTETAAVREIEEECNVKAKIIHKLGETWHTYTANRQNILKCTHWYQFVCLEDKDMKPQREEGIDSIEWINATQVQEKVMADTYPSIREVYRLYMNLKK
jgi:8-oxo-dGTP pyrophosphatase MutT (NUDIX family)